MGLAGDQVRRRGVGRHGGERDDHVAERVVGLEAAARADPQEARDAELDELLEDDRRRRAAHARALDGDGLALPGAGVPEEPSLLVDLPDVRQVGLGDVLRPERVTREQAGLGVVAGISAKVDRHARNPTVSAASEGRGTGGTPL